MKASARAIMAGTLTAALVAGCTWVKLKPEGEKVRILSRQEVGRCKSLGRVSVSTAATVGFIARGKDTVQDEVNRLARNNAADMDGDTVVPAGPLVDGEQRFNVYRCINP